MVRVQVHLRADKLDNIASGGWRGNKSSPYAKVTMTGVDVDSSAAAQVTATGEVELGMTEVIPHNLSPNWTKIFILDYDETVSWTNLKISLHDSRASVNRANRHGAAFDDNDPNRNTTDIDSDVRYHHNASPVRRWRLVTNSSSGGSSLYGDRDPTMGEASVEVGEVLGSEGQEVKCPLNQGGCLYVHITESIGTNRTERTPIPKTGQFLCHIRGLDLENIEKGVLGLGAIDPYFELSKKYLDPRNGQPRWVPVYRSEHIPDIVNPYWQPFCLDMEKLCHGDEEKKLRITVMDYEKRSSDRFIGEFITSVGWLKKSVSKHGNAGREEAFVVQDGNQDQVGLIVVLQAGIR